MIKIKNLTKTDYYQLSMTCFCQAL